MAHTPTNVQRLIGVGGLWNEHRLQDEVISLVPTPRNTILNLIPSFVSENITNDIIAFLTKMGMGDTDPRDFEGGEQCGDCVTVGEVANCFQKQPWGRVCMQSKNIDLNDYGMRNTRSDHEESLYLVNPPGESKLSPTPARGGAGAFKQVLAQQQQSLGLKYLYWLARTTWFGDPIYNLYDGDRMLYGESYGLASLINTGHKDERDGSICRDLDSIVIDWSTLGDDITEDPDAQLFVNHLLANIRYVWDKASKLNFNMDKSRDWVLVMPENLFFALTRIWPCLYKTNACADITYPTNLSTNIDLDGLAEGGVLNPDVMYNGNYLLVHGVRVPVQIEDILPEVDNGDGSYTTSVYYVPLRYAGNRPALYWEFFNFGAAGATGQLAAELGLPATKIWMSDSDRFLWQLDNTKTCFNWQFMARNKLTLKIPNVAIAINNVTYSVIKHTLDVWPGSPYSAYEDGHTYTSFPENIDLFGEEFTHKPTGPEYSQPV